MKLTPHLSKRVVDPLNTFVWFAMDALWMCRWEWPAYAFAGLTVATGIWLLALGGRAGGSRPPARRSESELLDRDEHDLARLGPERAPDPPGDRRARGVPGGRFARGRRLALPGFPAVADPRPLSSSRVRGRARSASGPVTSRPLHMTHRLESKRKSLDSNLGRSPSFPAPPSHFRHTKVHLSAVELRNAVNPPVSSSNLPERVREETGR